MTGRARGRPRDPEADAAILKAALELFVERGIEGMSIEQVAKRAGVAKLTVYRRWPSKEELLSQAFESARSPIPDATSEEIAEIGLSRYVEQTLDAQVEVLTRPSFRAMVARVLGTSVSHPKLMETYWRQYILPRRQAMHTALEQAKTDGLIAADVDNEALIDMMVGAIMYRLLQPDPLDAAQLRAYLESVYRQAGLLPRSRAEAGDRN